MVKSVGGQQAYVKLLKNNYEQSGVRFNRMVFGQPADKRRYGDITLATVPYTMTVNHAEGREAVASFYYAFSGRNQKAWFFMDCSNASDKLLAQLVKGFDGNIKKPVRCE